MSKLGIVSLVVLSLALDAAAAFKLPKSVYRVNNLEDASTEAESKGKAITFIYTDENSTCGLCDSASLNLIEQLDKKTVVVYADCSKDLSLLPSAVQKALSQPAAGRYIPKTVIVDAGMTNVLAVVPYP